MEPPPPLLKIYLWYSVQADIDNMIQQFIEHLPHGLVTVACGPPWLLASNLVSLTYLNMSVRELIWVKKFRLFVCHPGSALLHEYMQLEHNGKLLGWEGD